MKWNLLYDLGDSAASVAGSVAGTVAAGAVVGSVIPGAGTVVGAVAGLAGGVVGCAVASEAYATAVELGTEGAGVLADKAQELANGTIELAKEHIPDSISDIKAAFNNFSLENKLPFKV